MTGWTATWVTAACVGLAGWRSGLSLHRLDEPAGARRSTHSLPRGGGRTLGVICVCAMALATMLGLTSRAVLGSAAALALAVVVRHVIRLGRERRARRVRQRRVVGLCDALAAELRGGLPMTAVVRRCCRDDAELAPIVLAAELGGDIAGAFRDCARLPGAAGLRAVAAAWDVAGHTGSALSGVLDRISAGLRDDEEARAEVVAALGPPRATAKLLAGLPLFGLALGASIDAHPVQFLLGTAAGLVCLGAGTTLALSGMWWVERLASRAEG